MDRKELLRRVETGIMVLLVVILAVIFALNYDPNSSIIMDQYLHGKGNSVSTEKGNNSSRAVSFDTSYPSDTSEKIDNTTDNNDSAVGFVPSSATSDQPPKTESSVDNSSPVNVSSVDTTQQTGLININHADLNQLQQLNGIGKVKAQAIIDYREARGAFQTIDELVNVEGIGEKTLEKNRDKITV